MIPIAGGAARNNAQPTMLEIKQAMISVLFRFILVPLFIH
jgi:hypothetical protein